jgi:hypothetical protein
VRPLIIDIMFSAWDYVGVEGRDCAAHERKL